MTEYIQYADFDRFRFVAGLMLASGGTIEASGYDGAYHYAFIRMPAEVSDG